MTKVTNLTLMWRLPKMIMTCVLTLLKRLIECCLSAAKNCWIAFIIIRYFLKRKKLKLTTLLYVLQSIVLKEQGYGISAFTMSITTKIPIFIFTKSRKDRKSDV